MSIEYTWKIDQMMTYPKVDSYTEVVFAVYYIITGTEGTITQEHKDSVAIEIDTTGEFTPYDQLTEEQVIQWVKDELTEEKVVYIEGLIAQQISEQQTPTTDTPGLPWQTNQ